jgi:hypothetical protein
LKKITDGAVTFDGASDYLSTTTSSSDFTFGTGDFTVEMFLYNEETAGKGFIQFSDSSGGLKNTSTGVITIHKDNGQNGVFRAYAKNGSTGFSTPVPYKRWCHVALVRESGTIKLFVDGKQDATTISSDTTNYATTYVAIGGYYDTGYLSKCIISNVRVNKGTAVYTSEFTPPFRTLTNVTNTKLLCCQSNTSAIAAAVIPTGSITANGNSVATTFNPFNTDINTVRGQETGYATWNPLTKSRGNILDGNLLFYGDGTNTPRINGTISQSSGKWYYEATVLNDGPGTGSGDVHNSIGWGFDNVSNIETAPNNSDMQHSFYFMDSGYYKNFSGSNTDTSTGKWLAGDVIGVAADLDNNTLTFYKNNVQVLSQTIGTTAGTSLCPAHQSNTGTYGRSITNFGQKPFKFPPPDGFQPLTSSTVRPDTVIARPDQYVSATIYTGNQSVRTISTGNTPDLVWIKDRTDTNGHNHNLIDTVRDAPNILQSDTTAVQITDSTDGLTSFTSNGFTLGANVLGNQSYELNKTGNGYVAWCWKAGGNKNTFNVDDVGYASAAAAGLDGGTLSPTGASVGTKQGFSIVKVTLGTASGNVSISHGLGKTPDFIIAKSLTNTFNWDIYHKDATPGGANRLQFTSGAVDSQDPWGNVAPSSSVFTFNAGFYNDASASVIYYSWADVPGLQKFGSYEGNTSTDGPFIELGFKPAIVWIKHIDEGSNRHWCVIDTTRSTDNNSASAEVLFLDDNQVESYANNNYGQFGSKPCIDILSNGFKVREGDSSGVYTQTNRSDTLIYCAWAEAPVSGLYGAQPNAR